MNTNEQVTQIQAFADAMEQGAKLVPQGFDDYFELDDDGRVMRACAIGATFLAIEHKAETPVRICDWTADSFPALLVPDKSDTSLWEQISNWNDKKRWSRERIAHALRLYAGFIESEANRG